MDEKGNVSRLGLENSLIIMSPTVPRRLFPAGTTGESVTLSHDEHGDVVMMTLELADGRIPVIAGTGANATAEAISLTQRFNDSGIVGCLDRNAVLQSSHRRKVVPAFQSHRVEHTDLPQILYNVPSRTGCDMLPETVGRLAEIKNIIAIKEAIRELNPRSPDQRAGFRRFYSA
ncbi:dihydrodipicolinate synthase family protein [Salmonella enterica subsp. enterica]|nr:dihydrodipicolinate synthase family protein [Salmonella enterica subsp. enterica]